MFSFWGWGNGVPFHIVRLLYLSKNVPDSKLVNLASNSSFPTNSNQCVSLVSWLKWGRTGYSVTLCRMNISKEVLIQASSLMMCAFCCLWLNFLSFFLFKEQYRLLSWMWSPETETCPLWLLLWEGVQGDSRNQKTDREARGGPFQGSYCGDCGAVFWGDTLRAGSRQEDHWAGEEAAILVHPELTSNMFQEESFT